MKKIVVLSVLILSAVALIGQSEEMREDIDFYKESLQIQEDQQVKLTEIISKKHNDLVAISEMRNSDELKYRQKRRVIHRLTDNSIRMLLKEEQIELWDNYKKAQRIKNASLIKELQSKNADKEDLKDAQYGIVN